MLNESSQTQKATHKIFRIGKSLETESRLIVALGWGLGEMGSDCLLGTGFPFGVMEIFWNQIAVNVLNTTEFYTLKWFRW